LKKREIDTAPEGLHVALLRAHRPDEAARFEQTWLQAHPRDVRYRWFLSRQAAAAGHVDSAIEHLQRLQELTPDSALVHNNLAHLLWQKQHREALPLAERAVELAPHVPAFLDTLATILAGHRQFERALQMQRRALDLAPDSGLIRLNLVRMLVETKDFSTARDELSRLSPLGPTFAGHVEVVRLSNQLGLHPPSGDVPAEDTRTDVAHEEPTVETGVVWLKSVVGVLLLAGLPSLAFAAAIRPKAYEVEGSVRIHAKPESVFAHLRDLRRWESWSCQRAYSARTSRTYSGTVKCAGVICTWQDEKSATKGKLEVLHVDAPNKLVVESVTNHDLGTREWLKFGLTTPDGDGTLLTYTLQGREAYWSRWLGLFVSIERRKGRQQQRELSTFKARVEADLATGETDMSPDGFALALR
jgi:tetratricopeptide (TPR) repeat protein